jgi:serine/threonine protein kinase
MATVHFGRLQGAAGFARSVAIKRLHPQYAKDPDFVGMFLDEARLAARIAHPNVVPTLDVVAQGDELLLVMEYVRGSSLSRLLRTLTQKGERMPPHIAAAIAAGVLRGLHAAHEAKSETGEKLEIVHRDVSPQNILVGTDGIARVLDFGVAKAAGRVQTTREGQLKGKLAYMAPEQITTGAVTRKTDVYAAAVVLWEMLTGRRLFRADNEAKLLALVLDSEVFPPTALVDNLPEGFDPVVLRGLDRDPAKRYATAREMAIDVEAVVGIAPSTEVGEWVELVAADELRERANRIEEIERSVQGSSPGIVSHAWPINPALVGARRVDEPSTVQHGRAATALPPLPVPRPPPIHSSRPPAPTSLRPVSNVSQVSNLSTPSPEPPPRSRKGSAAIIALAFVACAVGGTFVGIHMSSRAGDGKPAGASAATTVATNAPPVVVPPTPATAEVKGPEPAVTAAPSAPVVSGVASVTGKPAYPFVGAAPVGARPGFPQQPMQPQLYPRSGLPVAHPPGYVPPAMGAPAAPRPTAVASDCNPPYTTDEKGHIHFKPACVN